MKYGIFGGTFDPVHVAHLRVAVEAKEHLGLDVVLVVPAFLPPHKQKKTVAASAGHRLAMLKLAVSPWKFIKVLDFELRKGRVVYTIDTIRYIRKRFGEKNRYFLLIGSDWTAGIRGWRSYAEIRKLTRIVVFPRTRNAKIPKTFLKLSCSVLAVESSAIRTGLKKRRPGLFVPPVILDYIRNHRLYQN